MLIRLLHISLEVVLTVDLAVELAAPGREFRLIQLGISQYI